MAAWNNYTHQQWNNTNESMGTAFLEKITLTQLVEEFPIFNPYPANMEKMVNS